jgi:predicted O-methyltransferase YrrM
MNTRSLGTHGTLGTPEILDPEQLEKCTLGLLQESSAGNAGYGNLYFSLVRLLRPQHVLVIGSGYGFGPAALAQGLVANGAGKLTFVDPSMHWSREGLNATGMGTGQWDTPEKVQERFACAGIPEGVVTHYRETNHEFFGQWAARGLPPIDLALIDGAHDEANASFDLASVVEHLTVPGYVLMHDVTHFLNHTAWMGVTQVVEQARKHGGVEEITFPGEAGLALLRFTSHPAIEIQLVPPPSVFWPIFSVFGIGLATGLTAWALWPEKKAR